MSAPISAPPGPRLLPFIGLGMKMQGDLLGFMSEAARRFGGVVRLGTLGTTPAFLVSDPELVGQVMQRRWHDFVRDEVVQVAGAPVFGKGLLFAEGELWLMLRRTMQPAFTRERLAALVPGIQREVERRCDRWAQAAAKDEPIPMAIEMARLTQEVFVRVLDAIVGPLVQGRRRELAEGREGDDLLGMLLGARDPETGEGLDDALLRDQILMTFFAGFETTSTALAWVWILLARHPEIEARLHAELDEVLGGRAPTAEDLPRLRYMQQVLDETLRLYPSAFMLARAPVGDQELGGYTIPGGALVLVCLWVLHRDPTRWPDPERFDPERFAPSAPERDRFEYLPFGAGPRLCIGKQLALMEAKLVLATLAQRFAPRPVPGAEYRPRPLFTLHLEGGAPMRPCPR